MLKMPRAAPCHLSAPPGACVGRAAWRSRQEPAGKEGQLPTAIWAEGGAGGGVVPARGVGLPFNSLISNFLQLRRRRRGRCPRAGKVPEKAGNISTLPQAAGPLSSLRSVVSKRAWVPGMPPSPSRAERSPGAHLPVARLSPLPEGYSALRGHTGNPAPTSGLSPHLHHLPSAQGTPRASGAGVEAPLLPLPRPQGTAGAPQVRSSRATAPPDRSQGRTPSLPFETPPHAHLHPGAKRPNAPEPGAQVALPSFRSEPRGWPGRPPGGPQPTTPGRVASRGAYLRGNLLLPARGGGSCSILPARRPAAGNQQRQRVARRAAEV